MIRSSNVLTSAIASVEAHDQKDHPIFLFLLAILQAALLRRESRGGHYRSDFPEAKQHATHSTIKFKQELLHVDTLISPL